MSLDLSSIGASARVVAAIGSAVLPKARQLYAERQAIQFNQIEKVDLLDRFFTETLGHLTGPDFDDAWWKNLCQLIGHEYVAPDFFCIVAVRNWLRIEHVQRDIKSPARSRIVQTQEDESIKMRLGQAYAIETGEREELAAGPIDAAVSALVAGFLSALKGASAPLAALVQAGSRENLRKIEELAQQIGPSETVTNLASNRAQELLSRITKRRGINPDVARAEIARLVQRIGSDGDLNAVNTRTRCDILYWAARMNALDPQSIATANSHLNQIERLLPDYDTRIVMGLMIEAKGDADRALRFLRDIDSPDGRAAFFSRLISVKGRTSALKWIESQKSRQDPYFLTPLGWQNVIIALATERRCEDAVSLLDRVVPQANEWPDLFYVGGVLHVALMLPNEFRSGLEKIHGPLPMI